ncbi:APG6-domain-containing protein [Athelia psychrophila]|uniref:APG6-domain-containing protein n=1 Tax=Athelia psychrophila TaxID=1759441 RepID=A0A167VYY0_9AGAM|nr:APG6-domain-containing protein [Fibularhizoctonia sp. CBS 109695]
MGGNRALSPRAQGKQKQRPLQDGSFVMLQDSVVRMPSHPMHAPAPAPRRPSGAAARDRGAEREKLDRERERGERDRERERERAQEDAQPTPIAHHLRSTQRLLALLAARTEVDHPLCDECTQILLGALQRTLDETKKERDGYIAFEKEVRKERERERERELGMGGGRGEREVGGREEMERRIERLGVEERVAVEHLKEAEREREKLDEELRALEAEERALEEEEANFWRAHNTHLLAATAQSSALASLQAAHAADAATLERLERTNVYNDAFCIGHDGVFGTINGLRLGRVPSVPVEWAEINAAWGQTLLLLATVARKLDYTFPAHRLVPNGSFSRIEALSPPSAKTTHELYGSGDLHIGRLLHNRRFDWAMVAFLECLRGVMEWVKGQDPGVDFPHQIVKDKIGDVSVKLQFSQEDAWTRALRHVLLALKILLKWATSGSNA